MPKNKNNSLDQILQDHIKNSKTVEEEYTMSEYFDIVRENPKIAALAHQRVYDMIASFGIDTDEETGEVRYKFFEKELFGIEDSTKQIMEYFKGAATGSEVGRRLLLLYGPPSSGKSNLLTMIKRGLEKWSHTDAGATYAIDGCPMHEEPLNAIPKELRPQVSADLKVRFEKEQNLCPRCQYRLRTKFDGDFLKFPVKRIYMSEQNRVGIGTFVPSDPKSQDVAELIGGIDLAKVGEYGSESHPEAYKFDGELNVSSRGMVEFVEILKVDQKFLYVLLTATQEKQIKTPRYPLLYIDEAIISHTNESEYRDFVGNEKNEALIDRMIVNQVKYNLKVDEEIKIYNKLFGQGDADNEVHVAPHTFRVAAIFAILSRLIEPKDSGLDKVKKMKLYNNQEVEGFSLKDIPRLKRESPREGMDGVSPRYVVNRLVTTAIRAPEGKDKDGNIRPRYITPIEALRSLKDGLSTSSKFKPEERNRFEQLLQLTKQEFDILARNEVRKAFFVSFEDEAKIMMDNYLDMVEAYLEKVTVEDPITHEEIQPDEKLMRSIESKIGVSESGKDTFRQEIIRKVGIASRRGLEFRYQDHARLREAIENELFEDKRDVIKMTISSRTAKDPEQLKRVNEVIRELCDNYGYIEESANELLRYVSSMIGREK